MIGILKHRWRSIALFLLGCIVLALVIFVCFQLHTRLGIVALFCLLTIVVISLQGRFFVALLCSVLATLGLDYFFTQPVFSLAVTRPEDIAALFTFVTIALVVSGLGYKVRKSYCELAKENTERKRAEEQQRYHMELLKTVTDNASSMLYMVDAAGLGTFVNPAFERITGYRAEEVLGQAVHAKIHQTKPDGTPYPMHECPLIEAARTGKIMQGEDLFVRKDNTFFPVRYTASPIFREGVAVGSVIEVQDLTDHKRAEEAWREAQAQLAHVTRVATLGELAGTIAHEVNQPLTAVINNADACLALLPGEISKLDELREALSDIISDADRASAVLARIRGLIKKSAPQKSRLDLNETICGVIDLARGQLDRNEVLLRTKLANDLPLVMGDRIHLQQVILNLVINAIEALSGVSQGPRELWISSEKVNAAYSELEHLTPIRFGSSRTDTPTRPDAGHEGPGPSLAEAEATYALVSVADSGPGLDLNNMDRLFDAFYTTKPQGLGMGLSISRSIIEANGGRLWAKTNVPKGALFQFTLPIAYD
jgi:PAS domain S-box-containing protein